MQQTGQLVDTSVNLVWLKRDLRLRDHQPLLNATLNGKKIVVLFLFEPMLIQDPHFDIRHWRFVWQSIEDLNKQLREYQTKVLVRYQDARSAFQSIAQQHNISAVYSYQEIGLDNTFERDKEMARWFSDNEIEWQEFECGAVKRGLKRRLNWQKNWYITMRANCDDTALHSLNWINYKEITGLDQSDSLPQEWKNSDPAFQQGGECRAWYTLHHFFEKRGKEYTFSISSPIASRAACSRLSPYLAWGNISIRQVYQFVLKNWQKQGWRRTLVAFSSRLHWHCHFVQKFESESQMQFRPVNKAYLNYQYLDGPDKNIRLNAWKSGNTGFPLIDACMRCLHQTGYINFRMRSMLVSFLCHHLDIDWRDGVTHLASMFLDFEPGIHYPQFQMQAGVTGINIIRLYNPIKQSKEKDPDGEFIRRFIPEISALPNAVLHTPWLLTAMEEQLYSVIIGEHYPKPIIDIDASARRARDKLWAFQKRDDVQHEGRRILKTHTLPDGPRNK
ncbi:MAG: deoxyribodipyrimidine photo-lyase [Paraglaciecola sp.]|jgi:deoxyribodipyrimidine photo-lyase